MLDAGWWGLETWICSRYTCFREILWSWTNTALQSWKWDRKATGIAQQTWLVLNHRSLCIIKNDCYFINNSFILSYELDDWFESSVSRLLELAKNRQDTSILHCNRLTLYALGASPAITGNYLLHENDKEAGVNVIWYGTFRSCDNDFLVNLLDHKKSILQHMMPVRSTVVSIELSCERLFLHAHSACHSRGIVWDNHWHVCGGRIHIHLLLWLWLLLLSCVSFRNDAHSL